MLETERLILRQGRNQDFKDVKNFRNSDFVRKYNMLKIADEKEICDELAHSLVMVEKASQKVIGVLEIERDHLRYGVRCACLSYYMDEKKTQRGYMHEALKALISDLFTQGYDVVSARVFLGNDASVRVLKRLGFQQEGTLRHAVLNFEGIVFDDQLFSILKEEWEDK